MKIPGWYWKEDKWKINYKELEKYIKEYKIENPNKKLVCQLHEHLLVNGVVFNVQL